MSTGCPDERFERNYKWAARFARSYCIKRHIREPQLDDCVQAACIAFWKCCNTFDELHYSSVRAYAARRIIGAIKDQQRIEAPIWSMRKDRPCRSATVSALSDYSYCDDVCAHLDDDEWVTNMLNDREQTVYRLLSNGYTQADIARLANASEALVSITVGAIRDKVCAM